MKKQILPALILSLGIVIMGESLASAIRRFSSRDRVVTVRGLSEREVSADKVTWPIIFKELGNDPAVIFRSLDAKNSMVADFLKREGLSDAEISINPPKVTDRYADNWGAQRDITNRYVATGIVIVSSSKIDLVRSIMKKQTELMKMGIALITEEYGSNRIKYEFSGLNDIKPAMVEESTKNARATAEKFATDSGSELGKIRRATQGQFSITDRDENTPHIKNVRVVSTIEYYIDD